MALIAAVETRIRKRRQADELNHHAAVRRVLANGLRCHYFRHPALVAYYRKADSYKGSPSWLSGDALSRTVDLMVRAGLLDASLGRWGTTASTYSVTDKLCGVAKACGITDHSLTIRVPLRRLVRLREGNSKTRTQLVNFDPTGDTIRWISRLRAYNVFLTQQDIDLKITADEEAEWVRRLNENGVEGGVRLYRPELIQTDLYRQFNNGSFGQGGRLYGGWWINAPKALRQKITINGQPTVELDFSGCAIRMLYHERGLEYKNDPYRLEDIAALEAKVGRPDGYFREGIKALTQALINDQHGKKPEMISLPDGLSFRPHFKRRQVRQMIEEKHVPIADTFGTGAGLRLQRKDSDLALDIITELMANKIVALPVHDSFLVCRRDKFITGVMMSKFYHNMFGFNPVIE